MAVMKRFSRSAASPEENALCDRLLEIGAILVQHNRPEAALDYVVPRWVHNPFKTLRFVRLMLRIRGIRALEAAVGQIKSLPKQQRRHTKVQALLREIRAALPEPAGKVSVESTFPREWLS